MKSRAFADGDKVTVNLHRKQDGNTVGFRAAPDIADELADQMKAAARRVRGVSDEPMPAVLRGIAPSVGDIWEWEPLTNARQTVRVTAVIWDGGECRVESELLDGTDRSWNDLGRWIEATVLVTPASE